MKKYYWGLVMTLGLMGQDSFAMQGERESEELSGPMRALNLEEGYARSIRVGGTCQSIDRNLPEDLEGCSSLEVTAGNLTQTFVLDYLYEKLQQFPALRKIRIAIGDASGDVVRNFMVRAGTIGVDAGLPEEIIKHAMRLGLSETEIQTIGREEDAGASFAPVLQIETPETLNWGAPGNIQKVLSYLETLLGAPEPDAGFDPAIGARPDQV